MSLDITIKERKEFRCPDCGRLVTTQDVANVRSGGGVWFGFLEKVKYYAPCENEAKTHDWYGLDMVLDDEQSKQLAEFVSSCHPSACYDIENLVARALMYGNKVVINVDW